MPIEYNGQILRSKNELIGCKVLEIDGAIESMISAAIEASINDIII